LTQSISNEIVIPSERSEPRDPFDSAFDLAQDKPVGSESARFCLDSIAPSARAQWALGRDDKTGTGFIPPHPPNNPQITQMSIFV